MAELGIDISGRVPRVVDLETLKQMDYVVMMGCYVAEFTPNAFSVDSREWELPDPEGQDLQTVRQIRDALEQRVSGLFDEIEQEVSTDV
jgi:protein-tyrosine-phosphatase